MEVVNTKTIRLWENGGLEQKERLPSKIVLNQGMGASELWASMLLFYDFHDNNTASASYKLRADAYTRCEQPFYGRFMLYA